MLCLLERDPEDLLLCGPSPAAARLRSFVDRVARAPRAVVLLLGGSLEAELLARSIHARTPSREGPLLTVDGDPDPGETTAELASLAEHGTLLWKRIDSLGATRQRELERFLEEPLAPAALAAAPRLVAATGANLATRVGEGRFREDLYYRLNVMTLRIPSLTERFADLEALARRALRGASAALGRTFSLAPGACKSLRAHAWRGGMLELESLVFAAALRSAGSTIARLDALSSSPGGPAPEAAAPSLRDLEEAAIRRALWNEHGNRSRAARSLGIHRATLYDKLRLYRIA